MQEVFLLMLLVYMIYTAMFGNGVQMLATIIIMEHLLMEVLGKVEVIVMTGCSVAVAGSTILNLPECLAQLSLCRLPLQRQGFSSHLLFPGGFWLSFLVFFHFLLFPFPPFSFFPFSSFESRFSRPKFFFKFRVVMAQAIDKKAKVPKFEVGWASERNPTFSQWQ